MAIVMNCKKRIGICIFTFGVLMFLLRPCLAYQMTSAVSYKTNSARAWSLSQRLIKKKDDHHEQQTDVNVIKVLTEKTLVYTIHLLNVRAQTPNGYPAPLIQRGLYHCFQPGAP